MSASKPLLNDAPTIASCATELRWSGRRAPASTSPNLFREKGRPSPQIFHQQKGHTLPDKHPPERQKRRLLALQAALGSAPRALRRDACSGTSKASAAASTRSLARSAILVARASSSFSPATAAWPGPMPSAPSSSPRSATTATKAAASSCTAYRRRPKPNPALLRHSQAPRGRRAVSRPASRQDSLCSASQGHGGLAFGSPRRTTRDGT